MKSSLISFSLAYAFTKVREFPHLTQRSGSITLPGFGARTVPAARETPGLNTSARDGFALVTDPEGEAAERYREFIDEILGRAWPLKRMLITSPGCGEGKTLTSVNLALALAERGLTVFLIELTLTRPRYRYVFGAPDSLRGIESVLSGEAAPEEAALQLGDTRIAVCSVANAMGNNDLLTRSENLQRLIRHGESTCDWIVLDAPAIGSCDAVKELASEAGPVVMVARSLKTRLEVFRKAA